MLYSQTVLEQNKAASVSDRQLLRFNLEVEVVSVLVAWLAFLYSKTMPQCPDALAFFFFFFQRSKVLVLSKNICASLALLSANIALFLQRAKLSSI